MDRENCNDGPSQADGVDESTLNFKPGENPGSDESEGMKGDNNTPDNTDAAKETHGTQDKATAESGTNGGVRAEAILDGKEETAMKSTSQMSVSNPLEEATESKTKQDAKEQEQLLQGTDNISEASKPESTNDGNADSDVSAKSDGDWVLLQAETEKHGQNEQTSGEEPIKQNSQTNHDNGKASNIEQNEISNSTPKEEPTNDQTNDGHRQSPSSGPSACSAPTVKAAPGNTNPEFKRVVGEEGPLVKEDATKEEITEEKSMTEQNEKRPVSISLCTSAYDFNVKGLKCYLNGLKKAHPELIKNVKIHPLPYNDLDSYRFSPQDPIDVMILCHSINNRRFAITDVMDALYDKYLPYCASVIGKGKMGVIVHDFVDMRDTAHSSRMDSFKSKQPKAFETTNLQITCGHIEAEKQVLTEMLEDDRNKLMEFLENASIHPEPMMDLPTEKEGTIGMIGGKVKRLINIPLKKAKEVKSRVISSKKPTASDEKKDAQPPNKVRKQDNQSSGSDVDTGVDVKRSGKKPTASDERKDAQPPNKVRKQDNQSSESDVDTAVDVKRSGLQEKPRNGAFAKPDPPPKTTSFQQRGECTFHGASTTNSPGSSSQHSMSQSSRNVGTSASQGSSYMTQSNPRPISVSICSSAYKHNVDGLMSWFNDLKAKHSHTIADVRFRELLYNDIDSFKFQPQDPVDVMVLCHSVDNRGFSITDVMNSIYNKYLKFCNDLIGKRKLAVIVHDFKDLNPDTTEVKMESFRRQQPSTFELVDTVILCGSLEIPGKIQMGDKEETQLVIFLEKARFEPKENLTISSQSFTNPLAGLFNFST